MKTRSIICLVIISSPWHTGKPPEPFVSGCDGGGCSVTYDDELVNSAVEIKLRAKRRAGQMLSEDTKTGDLRKAEDGQKCTKAPDTSQRWNHPPIERVT